MRRNLYILFIVLALAVICVILVTAEDHPNEKILVITVNGISPAYSLEKHERLFSTIDKYNATATLFVIPNYMGENPITENEAWINLVRKEQDKGYEIAQHGYMHTPYEFGLLDYNASKERLMAGRVLTESVFGHVRGFRPPYWAENYEVNRALEDLGYCYDADVYDLRFSHGQEDKNWFIDLVQTELEFETVTGTGRPFVLVLDIQYMDDESIKYLDEFLEYAKEDGAVFRTYIDVYNGSL